MGQTLLDRSDFNVGSDISLVVINNQTGERFTDADFGAMTDANADLIDKEIVVDAMNNGGQPLNMDIPHGAQGSFNFARQNGKLSKLGIEKANAWIDKGQHYNFTIQVQMQNRDLSVQTYLFEESTIGKLSLFKGKASKEVDHGFSFRCKRVRLTGG